MTQALAQVITTVGIFANFLCPSATDTEMRDAEINEDALENQY
jgi:hypothetical protein